jgi:hypothetical protein
MLVRKDGRFIVWTAPAYIFDAIRALKLAPLNQSQKNKLGL